MTAPLRVGCPTGDAGILGKINRLRSGPIFVFEEPEAFRTARSAGGAYVRERKVSGEFALDDERALRWADQGWYIPTWCPKCRRVYDLPVTWLRDAMNQRGGWVAGPRTAL